MSRKDQLPKNLRIQKTKREPRIYEQQISSSLTTKKNGILVPFIIFIVIAILLFIFFQGHLEVAIIVIAFIGLALLARWFFNR